MNRFLMFFIPLCVIKSRVDVNKISYIGHMKIYIFGILVAKIQMTNPW